MLQTYAVHVEDTTREATAETALSQEVQILAVQMEK